MRSIHSGSGYLLVDDTASGGKRVEADMLGCFHCQALIPKAEWKAGKSGAYCRQCDGPICAGCAQRMLSFGCEPFAKRFAATIDDHHRKTQNAKILGI